MAMPKTPVNEDGNLLAWKHEIWFAEHTRVSSPTADSILAKERDHPKFRVTVTMTADARHY
jgi:hypothetical protein